MDCQPVSLIIREPKAGAPCPTRGRCYHVSMAKQPSDKPDKIKRRPGPPQAGAGTLIGVRLMADDLELLDQWRETQPDRPGRPEAIRRLVEEGVKRSPKD